MSRILEVQGVSRHFNEIHALSDVSFYVRAGEIYGLLGPNGAGKTTAISIICGLISPNGGRVLVGDFKIGFDTRKAQRKMGVVPQEIALYEELTGLENLIFWGRLAGVPKNRILDRALEVLDSLELSDRKKDLVKTYSGGMKRRINIGCALMHEPELLLLDEPTVGIDPQARAKILEFVRWLAGSGAAVLYTTHYLEEAEQICSRIGIIDHGKILAEGSLSELQSKLGNDHIFVLDGQFPDAPCESAAGMPPHFRTISKNRRQWIVASSRDWPPSDCLKQLLALPLELSNVAFKKPNLNDVFLQLTGRELRE